MTPWRVAGLVSHMHPRALETQVSLDRLQCHRGRAEEDMEGGLWSSGLLTVSSKSLGSVRRLCLWVLLVYWAQTWHASSGQELNSGAPSCGFNFFRKEGGVG